MPKAVFVLNDNSEQEVEVARFESLMRAAVRNNVDGIAGDCGGGLTCATCHVYVDPPWLDRIGGPTETEAVTIEFANGVEATSRLSCQIQVTAEMDGLIVRTPAGQH